MSKSLDLVLSNQNRDTAPDDTKSLDAFIGQKVNLSRVAIFTLGKHASKQSPEDLMRLEAALKAYLVDLLQDALVTARPKSAEILRSFRRRRSECIVESKILAEHEDQVVLLWRVFREGANYWIQDVAIRDSGNTIWLSLELRAQFSVLLDKNDGSIDAVIQSIGTAGQD